MRTNLLATVLTAILAATSPSAQTPCSSNLTFEQQQRHRTAIAFVRAFNTAQARYMQQHRRWADLTELTASEGWIALAQSSFGNALAAVTPNAPDGAILPGFRATTIKSAEGYALVIRDKQDACGQTLTTTHEGLIIVGVPLR
jgi:hypothetical protein